MNNRMELIDDKKATWIIKPDSICIVKHEGKFVPGRILDVRIEKDIKVSYYVYILRPNKNKELVIKRNRDVYKSMAHIDQMIGNMKIDCQVMFEKLDIEVPK